MKISSLKRKSRSFRDFKKKEWELINIEHYGKELDEEYWRRKPLISKAVNNGNLVGVLCGQLMAGALDVAELIVKHDERGRSIGKKLMVEAERWARKQKAHEIYLVTGANWKAVKFYKNLDFQIAAKLPNHFSRTDFYLMRKFL